MLTDLIGSGITDLFVDGAFDMARHDKIQRSVSPDIYTDMSLKIDLDLNKLVLSIDFAYKSYPVYYKAEK